MLTCVLSDGSEYEGALDIAEIHKGKFEDLYISQTLTFCHLNMQCKITKNILPSDLNLHEGDRALMTVRTVCHTLIQYTCTISQVCYDHSFKGP